MTAYKSLSVIVFVTMKPPLMSPVRHMLSREEGRRFSVEDYAMDRAHRIGQKKVVNVYRLISRGTLEEKIMGLQKFKLSIANSVITQDNSSLQSMDTSQLLDLFSVKKGKSEEKKEGQDANKRTSMKVLLEDIGELWDERQYENEYNLDSFIESLNTK
eukprot:gene9364-17069_t